MSDEQAFIDLHNIANKAEVELSQNRIVRTNLKVSQDVLYFMTEHSRIHRKAADLMQEVLNRLVNERECGVPYKRVDWNA